MLWCWTNSIHSDTRGRKYQQPESRQQLLTGLFTMTVGWTILHYICDEFDLNVWDETESILDVVSPENLTSPRRGSKRFWRPVPMSSWPRAASMTCVLSTSWMSAPWQWDGFWRRTWNALPRQQEVRWQQTTVCACWLLCYWSFNCEMVLIVWSSSLIKLRYNSDVVFVCSQPPSAPLWPIWRERRHLRPLCWVRLRRLCKNASVMMSSSLSRSKNYNYI